MQEKSESSETEEKITKVREAPWIHPEAVADLIRSGEAEERDRPALIRLYIRAQMNFFGKPGKSGKSKDYWPDNQTIAECLGVPEYDVQNALRYSDIERIGGGKARGQGKRFRIVKKEWNHGGKKVGRKTSNQRDQSDSENVESTSATRNIDVCQTSDQRVRHVESAPATGLKGIGLEKKRMEGEGGGRPRADARQPKTPPPVSHDSFFRIGADEAMEYLNGFDLTEPRELAKAYYGLIVRVCGTSPTDGSWDAEKATLLLKGIPDAFRRQDVLASWMVWYVLRLGRRWDKATHYLTRFSDSWSAYRPLAEKAWSDRMAERQKIRAKEIEAMERQCRESREAEKVARRRAEEARRREEAEAQAKRKMEQDAFRKTLPTPEAIREAVGAVGVPGAGIGKYVGYMDFLEALLKAVPVLRLRREVESRWVDPVCNLLRKAKDDLKGLETRTRDFVASVAEDFLGILTREGHCSLPRPEATADMFVRYFGVDRNAPRINPEKPKVVGSETEEVAAPGHG